MICNSSTLRAFSNLPCIQAINHKLAKSYASRRRTAKINVTGSEYFTLWGPGGARCSQVPSYCPGRQYRGTAQLELLYYDTARLYPIHVAIESPSPLKDESLPNLQLPCYLTIATKVHPTIAASTGVQGFQFLYRRQFCPNHLKELGKFISVLLSSFANFRATAHSLSSRPNSTVHDAQHVDQKVA
ncbi:hypothetical protein K431DRAFT_325290 [Polychaeton citri CBS 116435]|uniref:Uncharacterized protein n=1 Tax=Polychaeton citri CBS 116435 TaxID=1314669 RepID=A0A9P4QD95_9PEZI|nr:hypothetical protein K431DRAFT_325290 [Polychaeton citri CBS 116435]